MTDIVVVSSPEIIYVETLNGRNGLSAYQAAVQNGFIGTESQWLASLQGLSIISVEFSAQNTITAGLVELIANCTRAGVAFTNTTVAVELLITDGAGEYEPSDTTIFLTPSAPIGQALAGITTARLTQRTDSNGQFKIALYEPTPSIKYLWLKASGNEQFPIVAKNGIKEVFF